MLHQDRSSNQYAGLFRSVQEAAEHKVDVELGGREGEKERFRDPVTRGAIPAPVFDSLTKSKIKLDGDDTFKRGGAAAEDSTTTSWRRRRGRRPSERTRSGGRQYAGSGKSSKGEESSIGPDKVDEAVTRCLWMPSGRWKRPKGWPGCTAGFRRGAAPRSPARWPTQACETALRCSTYACRER